MPLTYDAECSACSSTQPEPEGTTSITCRECGHVTNNIKAPQLSEPPVWDGDKWVEATEATEEDDGPRS